VEICDDDLHSQARKPRNKCLVLADGSKILGYCRYVYATDGRDDQFKPNVRVEFIAADETAPAGTGSKVMFALLIRISKDARVNQSKGVFIDIMNAGTPLEKERRWKFFVERFGFKPLRDHDDGDHPHHGYAFMPMKTVHAIAAASRPVAGGSA